MGKTGNIVPFASVQGKGLAPRSAGAVKVLAITLDGHRLVAVPMPIAGFLAALRQQSRFYVLCGDGDDEETREVKLAFAAYDFVVAEDGIYLLMLNKPENNDAPYWGVARVELDGSLGLLASSMAVPSCGVGM